MKFRGFRIELGEIETVLKAHPAIQESVVIVREDQPGQKRLVAYVTTRCNAGPGGCEGPEHAHCGNGNSNGALLAELKEYLRPKLPDYMVPSTLVVLAALPRTPNGKTDRKALPAPATEIRSESREVIPPRNEKEKILAEIWQEILGIKDVSVTDNFFELGGDSLMSFRVANRATKANLPLTPRMFFQHKTIADLVKAADESGATCATKPAAPAIARVSRDAHRRRLPAGQAG